MNINDYGYQPEKNLLLAMFDADLLSYAGQAPTVGGTCTIDKNQYPKRAEKSLYTASGGHLIYNIAPTGTSDFTLDFWMRYQTGYSGISTAVPAQVFGIVYNADVSISTGASGSGMVIGKAMTYATQWSHYALVRQGGDYYRFIDGKLVAAANTKENYNFPGNRIVINGRYITTFYGGPCNYKAVRLCNHARWTGDFTPPLPTLKTLPYLYLDTQNGIHGMQNQVFTRLNDDWTTIIDADKTALFLSTNYDVAAASDLATIGKFKVLTYAETDDKPILSLTAVPHDQLVAPNKLIRIESYDGIDKATIASTISGNGACKILVTIDLRTYQTYDFATQTWQPIDHTDLAAVKASGIDAAALQTIDRTAWDLLTTGKSGIGFAYFLSIDSTSDTCAVDKLTLQVDMRGSWDKAVHGTDYGYGYPYNTTLRVDIKKNGDYKINYCGGV